MNFDYDLFPRVTRRVLVNGQGKFLRDCTPDEANLMGDRRCVILPPAAETTGDVGSSSTTDSAAAQQRRADPSTS